MITRENILQHEFIGLDTQINESSNSQLVGINGTIINETKSMITVNTKRGVKIIPKSNTIWKFSLEGKEVFVNGTKIEKRSYDRLGGKTWPKILDWM